MDFAPSPRATEMLERLQAFMAERVFPAEPVYAEQRRAATAAGRPHDLPPVVEELKAEARAARAVEPVPARRLRPVAARLRAAGRADRLVDRARSRGDELRGAGHREHGGAAPVRHRRAEGAVARAAARRADPVRLRDDRAGRRVVGRAQHLDVDRARRRRVRRQRPQVVDDRRRRPALRGADRDGQHRPGRRHLPAAVDGARADGHARRDAGAVAAGVRLPRPARPRRDRVRRRAGAGQQPARRGGQRLRDRAGPARPGPGAPLHAGDRDGRARPRADGARARSPARRSAGRWPGTAWWPRRSPSPGWRSSRPGCWCSRPPG